jgi:hypothetical protein
MSFQTAGCFEGISRVFAAAGEPIGATLIRQKQAIQTEASMNVLV